MFKTVLRFCAAALLCLLLVYAPELFQTVRSSYSLSTPKRILLRIALCTPDSEAAHAFDEALPIYIKANPSIHIRILRSDDVLSPSSNRMLPDLLLLSLDQLDAAMADIADVFSLPLSDSGTLLGVIPHEAAHPEQAHSLLFLIAAQLGAPHGE